MKLKRELVHVIKYLKEDKKRIIFVVSSIFITSILGLSYGYLVGKLVEEITKLASDKLDKAMRIKEKLEKYAAIDAVKEEVVAKYEEENKEKLDSEELTLLITKVKLILENIEYDIFRSITVNEKTRSDGRSMTEIRPLSTAIDLLPRTHGSALFTRGETQALAITENNVFLLEIFTKNY